MTEDEKETPTDEKTKLERLDTFIRWLGTERDNAVVKLKATQFVLEERERELLELKGKCFTCRLHYAHAGPCDLDD